MEDVFPVAACHFAVPVTTLEPLFWKRRTCPSCLQGQASLKSATVLCTPNGFAQPKKYYLTSFMQYWHNVCCMFRFARSSSEEIATIVRLSRTLTLGTSS